MLTAYIMLEFSYDFSLINNLLILKNCPKSNIWFVNQTVVSEQMSAGVTTS